MEEEVKDAPQQQQLVTSIRVYTTLQGEYVEYTQPITGYSANGTHFEMFYEGPNGELLIDIWPYASFQRLSYTFNA